MYIKLLFQTELRKTRAANLQTTQSISESLSDKIAELLNNAQTMETILDEDKDAVNVSNRELEELLNENGKIFFLFNFVRSLTTKK